KRAGRFYPGSAWNRHLEARNGTPDRVRQAFAKRVLCAAERRRACEVAGTNSQEQICTSEGSPQGDRQGCLSYIQGCSLEQGNGTPDRVMQAFAKRVLCAAERRRACEVAGNPRVFLGTRKWHTRQDSNL